VSPEAGRAIEDAFRHGRALLKFISANDTGLTGSHQRGFYLPKAAWQLFTPHAPEKDRCDKSNVRITWQDGIVTQSVVTWYGAKTRSEYRLTSFGRGFRWLRHDLVGALLVLVPISHQEFVAYVIEHDEDIADVQAALNVFAIERWAVFIADREEETIESCTDRLFREFAESTTAFPDTLTISEKTREVVHACAAAIASRSIDEQLVEFIRHELMLFKMIERRFYEADVRRTFADIDDFVNTALSILNARKARAGRALENHIEFLFRQAGIPFQMRAVVEGTRPDIVIPGRYEYELALRGRYPAEKLIVIGVKTTCKDRWRQVLNEAPLVARKHILTLQEGISPKQLEEMHRSNVALIVPKALHGKYPYERHIELLDLETFIESVRRTLS